MTKKIFATILLFVTIIAATVNVSDDQISNDFEFS